MADAVVGARTPFHGGLEFLGGLEPERAERLARGSGEEKAAAVEDLIRRTSATAAVSALQPIPALDLAILGPLQHHLVRSIGLIHGRHLADAELKRMFRAVRRPIVVSQTLLVVAKLLLWVPWAPEAFSLSLAYALTYAIGRVSDECLSHPGMSAEQTRSRLEQISRERFAAILEVKRCELRALFRDPGTRHRVRELRTARAEGKIDDRAEVRGMEAILRRCTRGPG